MVLLRGLSPNSATVTHLHAQQYMGRREERIVTARTPTEAQRLFEMLFKPVAAGTSKEPN